MMPREHGAYMELAFPMLSALIVGQLELGAVLLAAAMWATGSRGPIGTRVRVLGW